MIRKYGRTALVAALILTILVSVIGGTIAWFTDEVASTSNIIKSGSLDVEMEYLDQDSGEWKDASEGTLFDYQLWEPGYTQLHQLKIANAGDLAFKYQLNFATDVQPVAGQTNLADVIDVYYGTDAVPTDAAGVKAGTHAGTIAELMSGESGISFGALLPEGETAINGEAVGSAQLWVALHMQESAGNEYQNLSVGKGFSVKLLAAQYTFEEDSFGSNYDAEAEFDLGYPSFAETIAELKKKYTSDASVIPAGMVINEDYAKGINIITLNDVESLLYFGYVLDAEEAYLNSDDYAAGHGYTSIWYRNASTRHVVLNGDIDLEGMVLPEGMRNFDFFDFDGQNHTISNAKIAYEGTDRAALFSGANRGVFNVTVKNIHVTAPNIVSGSAGILCSDPNASIDNVTVLNSSVKGGKYTGGVVGYNYGGVTNSTVKNCSISGRYKTGGIIGYICNSNNESKQVNGNTLDTVNVVVEDLLSDKQPVVGQLVGNWNCSKGECRNNTITNVTGATEKIGRIESNCIAGLVQD